MSEAPTGTYTRHEILTQPETWAATLRQLEKLDASSFPDVARFEQVIFSGCGSTYFLARWAARMCEGLHGTLSRASPASDLLLFPDAWRHNGRKTMMVAISRSGETTETIHAFKRFLAAGAGEALAITCYPQSTLAKLAPRVITVPEGQEHSVAQTRSFTNMLLANLWLFTKKIPAGLPDRFAELGRDLLEKNMHTAERLGRDESIQRFFFLGSGPLYGLANEAMLKMKEISLSYAESFHFHEFRHGPMSMVDNQSLVVGLVHGHSVDQQLAVLRDMKALGARTLGLLEGQANGRDGTLDESVLFHGGIPEVWRAPFYLPILQLTAYERAMHKGLNPDLPTNLTSVVVLNDQLE